MDAGFAFRGRTGVLSPAGGGDYALAINADNSNLGAGATWASDLDFDTSYRVLFSWNAGTGESRLWVDPVDMASTSISHTGVNTGDIIQAVAFRQSNDYTGLVQIDDITAADNFAQGLVIPEPHTVMLALFGGLLAILRRRRG